jgi:hypothetical protein
MAPVQRRLGLIARLLMAAACLMLVGCAIVDQYSGRAIVYNLEAELAQDQAILLNIVRAYLHRPMQFTTVASITGVANVSGGAQYTLPTGVPFRPPTQGATGIAGFPALPTWGFSGSMSGGPAFTVPVLDTQEFYQGILKAIPAQLWDLYFQANYPPDLLFNLFVQKVVMHRKTCPAENHTDECEIVFENYVGKDVQIDTFQALGDYFLWLGMTTELQKARTVPLNMAENVNVRFLGNPGPPGKNNVPTAEVASPPGGSAAADTSPAPKTYRLCFTPRTREESQLVWPTSLCNAKTSNRSSGSSEDDGADDDRSYNANQISSTGLATVVVRTFPQFIERLRLVAQEAIATATTSEARQEMERLDRSFSTFDRQWVTFTIYMRHTEGMIYYMGELARRSLSTDYGPGTRDIFARPGPAHEHYFTQPCGQEATPDCAYIFHLHENAGPIPGEFVSVAYNGRWYSISSTYDPEAPDRSSLSLDFLKQLIAVNSSAKSLPQSSVLSVVGGQ